MPEAPKLEHLKQLATLMRYYILTMTTQAGSGHPTSSLSAVELTAGLMFGGIFRYDLDNPGHPNNDRLIFSKGHASPLFYTLWAMAGQLTEAELMTYRHFGSGAAHRLIVPGLRGLHLIADIGGVGLRLS